MVVNTSKTKYIIIPTKGKTINSTGLEIVFADNEPITAFTLSLVKHTIDNVYTKNPGKNSRSYKI